MRQNHSRRKKAVPTTLAGILAVVIGLIVNHYRGTSNTSPAPSARDSAPQHSTPAPRPSVETKVPQTPSPVISNPAPAKRTSNVGWTSKYSLESHFRKHAGEFGNITIDDYLQEAKDLRDAPVGGAVLEIVRTDGVITRFNKQTGSFIAFNKDKSIRTLFRPDDGERYFRRQAERAEAMDD